MNKKTVNIDYLCVISENNGRATFETIDIPKSSELIATLEGMVDNDNTTVLDMQSQMNLTFKDPERKPINYVSPNSYESSFIDITYYPPILSETEYNALITSKRESLIELYKRQRTGWQTERGSSPNQLEIDGHIRNSIAVYKKSLKSSYLRRSLRFLNAYNYLQTLTKVRERADVRMYSTDTLGWSAFSYPVTDEITISLGTNFGYGSSSYFHLGLRYMGIDILPYSFMVKYYYADRRDLIRYTRLYEVTHDSWVLAFRFVEETANLASESPDQFVSKWILNEVEDMIHRLHGLLDTPNAYIQDYLKKAGSVTECDYLTVRNMDGVEKSRYGVYPQEMTMAIRAEKITGAIDFIDNLNSLSGVLPDLSVHIEEIKAMAVAIIPEIDEMIKTISSMIELKREDIKQNESLLESVKKELAPHEKIIDDLYAQNNENNKWKSRGDFEKEYASSHKDYQKSKALEQAISDKIAKIAEDIQMRSSFQSNLLECREKVSDAGLIAA